MATLADLGEAVVHGLGDVLLELARTAHADFLGDFHLGAPGADGGGGEQTRHAGTVLRIEGDHALAVGLALLDALGRLLGRHGDADGVAVALGHLAAVQTGQQRGLGEQGVHLGEDLAIAVVELACDETRELDVGQLIAAHGDHVALAEEDVAGLVHGIGEQKAGELVARGLHLSFHRGIALEFRLGNEREEGEHELVGRGYR